jgi:hypothetical protein
MTRTCKRCGTERNTGAFRKGFVCRKCEQLVSIAWAKRNPEKVRASQKRWRKHRPGRSVSTARHMVSAFAEMLGVTEYRVREIGTLQLTQCRSDSARRVLLGIGRPR